MRPPPRPGLQALPLSWERLRAFDCVIDTRSPAEFALDHLPGAINCPVLSNEERIQVGTLYKQVGSFEAKRLGAALVAHNIAIALQTQFHDKPRNWRPLVYCWRGGTRSGAMTHILRSVGWNAQQLEGGYKAWRAQLRQDLDVIAPKFRFIVVCGRTGSGKSRLLEALVHAGAQVLDLEQLAAHKGSVLGDLPDRPQPSQKYFDSSIWATLSQFESDRPVFVEAESKKIGALQVPSALLERMWQGECIEVVTAEPLRASLLREEYAHLITDPGLLFFKIDCLRDLHSKMQIDLWKSLATAGKWDEFVKDMLINHYDPAYQRSMFRNYVQAERAHVVEPTGIDAAAFASVASACLSLDSLPVSDAIG